MYTHRLPTTLLLTLALALPFAFSVQAQTPATTVKDGSGNVVLQSYTGGGLLAPDQGASSGDIPATGAGARLMWYPGKRAFRAGAVNGDQWNDGNIGTAFVAMGRFTTASGKNAAAMGNGTTASRSDAVAMGFQTTASKPAATAMGSATTASGYYAVAMGRYATADGTAAVAMGEYAKAASNNTFVWADGSDSSSDPFSSADDPNGSGVTGAQTFHVKASSGVRFITSGGTTYIPGNSTGWSTMSTRSAKTDVTPVDPTSVLAAVEEMPISTWEYKSEDGEGQGTRHIGPMAEDFHGTLPYDLGGSDDHINSINADGVALGAVKGLAQKVERQQATIDSLERRVQQIEDVKKRLAALEADDQSVAAGWIGGGPFRALGLLLIGGVLGAGLLTVRS